MSLKLYLKVSEVKVAIMQNGPLQNYILLHYYVHSINVAAGKGEDNFNNLRLFQVA